MAISVAPWTLSKIMRVGQSLTTSSISNFLALPVELREKIYDHVLLDIQTSPRLWNQRPISEYDGLLLACKQLRLEVSQHIFLCRASRIGLPSIMGMLPDKTNVCRLRALNLEVSYQADYQIIDCIAQVLDKFQLSIQELHLSFYGCDLQGNPIGVHGCGYIPEWHYNPDFADLRSSGQDVDRIITLLRQVTNLRNLRILHFENVNFSILPTILLCNKRQLQALCVVTDPRSRVRNMNRLFRSRPDFARGMLGGVLTKPNVKVLELDANAVMPAETIVHALSPKLEHFSWRIPNDDHQPRLESDRPSFEHMTCRILRMLSMRSPNLKTLRLCITRCSPNPDFRKASWETSATSQHLEQYLPAYTSLEHLELHDADADEFHSEHLISRLPYGLKRLYISDRLIKVDGLVAQVHRRFIAGSDEEYLGIRLSSEDSEWRQNKQEDVIGTVVMSISQRGYIQFYSRDEVDQCSKDSVFIERSLSRSDDFLADDAIIGEVRIRNDRIGLSSGKLGFVGFDYEGIAHEEDVCTSNVYSETNRTKIFRLNGLLLDREHNMHLASTQRPHAPYGVKPKLADSSQQNGYKLESGAISSHPQIGQALQKMSQLRWHPQYINDMTQDLEHCLDESMNWYFGEESEAEQVFHAEQAAPVIGQKEKSMLVEVEDFSSKRCRWSAPEYVVPPVGSFPIPMVPKDWRDDVRKGS